jgi:hypothetical protein
MSNYVGSKYIKSFGYKSLIKFYYYDQIKQIQIIYFYPYIWNILYEDVSAIYFPFYTEGVSHNLVKRNYLF